VSVEIISHFHQNKNRKYYTYSLRIIGEDKIIYESPFELDTSSFHEMSAYILYYRKKINILNSPSSFLPYDIPSSSFDGMGR
jgi:hypothetical protein